MSLSIPGFPCTCIAHHELQGVYGHQEDDAAEVEEDDTEDYAKPFAVLYVELLAELMAGTLIVDPGL